MLPKIMQKPFARINSWARHNGVRVTISSTVEPETSRHMIMLALRNVLRVDPLLDEVPVTAWGANTDEAAKKMLARIGKYGELYLINNGDKTRINDLP